MKKSTLLKIARAMLERAGVLFATTGNNAVNLAELVPDVAERRALALAIATWEGTAAKHNPKDKFGLGQDWILMRFASAMLGKEVRGAEMLEAAARGEITLSIAAPVYAAAEDPIYPAPDSEHEDPPFDVETHEVKCGTLAPAGFAIASAAEIAVHAEMSIKLSPETQAMRADLLEEHARTGQDFPGLTSPLVLKPIERTSDEVEPGSMLSSISQSPPTPPAIEERPDGWYWHDETWSPNGPHATRELAQTELDKYCAWLEGDSDAPFGEEPGNG